MQQAILQFFNKATFSFEKRTVKVDVKPVPVLHLQQSVKKHVEIILICDDIWLQAEA